jgi:hypothetical protein
LARLVRDVHKEDIGLLELGPLLLEAPPRELDIVRDQCDEGLLRLGDADHGLEVDPPLREILQELSQPAGPVGDGHPELLHRGSPPLYSPRG